ncbi:polysaccharide deacetylase family protein [Candidatus Nitrosotalea bavarica]|uniref:polysaccharide deacetylase family protein n=1 Tax=Candidatus Nitrosotalea bavarica TaxID=1903277 RepID=UPI001056D469|nr:polysaccharide deacetylase family protein [Candidatus Nitrosotalea bavarica]
MDKCKEDRDMMKLLLSGILIAILSITMWATIPAYADTTGSVAVTLTYTNGDTADYWPVSLKIYQDFNQTSYKEIVSLSGNPFNIVSLPIGHQYKIEAYANGMYSSVNYVNLQQPHQDITIKLPLPGGMRANVFYDDGVTPISNATVYVSAQDNKTWAHSPVDINGKTMRFWLEPTTVQNDFYIADVKIGNNLTYSQSPILLLPGIPQEIKIITNWPPVINTLITVNILDTQLHHVSSSNGDFVVDLYDNSGNKISQSPVTTRGVAYFSNLKVGDYLFKAIEKSDNLEWGTSQITLDGSKFSFDIVESQKVPTASEPTPIIPTPIPVTPETTPVTPTPALITPTPVIPIPSPQKIITNCNCVAFRLDNIQDYWLSNVQTKVIDVFEEKNASLTIGVIGNAFGNDTTLTEYIKSKIKTGRIDVGINGWSFEDFTTVTKSEQSQLLEQSKSRISAILNIIPSVFIPPYGESNNDTFYSMIDNDLHFISGNADTQIPPTLAGEIHSYPPTVFTDTIQQYNANQSMTNDEIITDIRNSIQANGYAVVTINFQDYAQNNGTIKMNTPDNEKILKLQSLIDDVRNDGYQIVTIKEISNPPSVPEFGHLATITFILSIIVVITIRSKIIPN